MNGPVPTQGDVSEMDRLRRIMEGDLTENTAPPPKILNNGEEAVVIQRGVTRQDVTAMENILNNFNSVENGAKSMVRELVDDAKSDRQLKEALVTTKTDNGAVIGAWEIKKSLREGLTKKNDTVYHVRNVNTGESIKAAFLILESAKALVKLLNQGIDLQNQKVKEIADLEINYRKMREKALTEKVSWHRAKKKNDNFKCDLHEAKFDAAKAKALYAKEKIKNIYYRL